MSEEIKEKIKAYYIANDIDKILNYITSLQQKVEQLEKENIKQKEIIENLTTMTVCGDKKQIKNTAQYKLEQLENIRKEAIGYIKSLYIPELQEEHICINYKETDYLLNILNKGSEE